MARSGKDTRVCAELTALAEPTNKSRYLICSGRFFGTQNCSSSKTILKSYDEIKAILEAALNEASAAHEALNEHSTRELLAKAHERYTRFILHGMIPEDLSDEDPIS